MATPTLRHILWLSLVCVAWSGVVTECDSDSEELDLCPKENDTKKDDTVSSARSLQTSHIWSFSLTLALQIAGAKHVGWLPLLVPLASFTRPVSGLGVTCSQLKSHYKEEACCGNPDQALKKSTAKFACPFDFDKPKCNIAEVQAPRDLSTGATGSRKPKAATLTDDQANSLPLTNVHYHLGAEHKSDDYKDDTDSKAFHSGRRLADVVAPGFMCPTNDLNATQLEKFTFQHCKGQVEVGKSYEIHYVHSSAGWLDDDVDSRSDKMGDGLGGAAHGRGLLNPMVVVQAQIYQIVNGADEVDDMLHGWSVVGHNNSVMYPGSTTGPSHTNEICSPYAITWHVDLDCHRVSPASFDKLCQDMKTTYNMDSDLYPHGSRILVDPKYVAKSDYVKPLV